MNDPRIRLRLGWARARLVFHTLHDLGLRTVGEVVAHSARRRRLGSSEWAERTPHEDPVEPGALLECEQLDHGARFVFERAELEVLVLADDVVRLSWIPGDEPLPYAAVPPSHWKAPAVQLAPHASGGQRLRSPGLEVHVASNGEVSLLRLDGTLLRQERAPRRRRNWWEHRYRPRAGERLSGLGEQAAGVDLSGGRYRLWNRDPGGSWGPGQVPLYVGIPVIVSHHRQGDLLSFYDNPASADVVLPADGSPDEEVSIRFAGGALRQYLMVGELPVLLERFVELTGHPAVPPRWALGYHQSRWGYRHERAVRAVLKGYRTMGVPLSAIHLDIDYMEGYRVFSVDRARFPDLPGLSEMAGRQGVRIVTIVDPAVKADPHYPLYRQGIEHGHFCTDVDGAVEVGVVWPGRAVFPDFTSAATRQWWAEQYRFLTDAGVSGVWHDMNEPTSISLAGDPTLPLSTRHAVEGRGGDHAQVHSLYGLLMNEAGYSGLRRARPDRRPFVLSRSGWAGNQRYAWNWTGDVVTSWDGLRQQVATVVGLGLSGMALSGSDTGGFAGAPDPELFLRWLQMSVFMGLCRTHSVVGVPPREPWRFPPPARRLIASWIRLRYRLLPYLYTLAHQAADHGAPLVRPLWWPAPDGGPGQEMSNADADDTFLLGDAVLVAPVTTPGSAERRVAFPSGLWRQWWARHDGAAHAGELLSPAPLSRIPVFVRAGSVIVLDDGWAEPDGPCALAGDDQLSAARHQHASVALDHAPRLLAFH
ncbi:MAG TPA: TIM-barrel domain-containing protein, partial [Acidimicrobiales bacterium]|nr:TIM-barrel domain-containing protein [Acidimicrobiales bacterium]